MRDGSHLLLLLLILPVISVSSVPVTSVFESENVESVHEIRPEIIQNGVNPVTLNGVLFKTVIRYYCSPPQLRENSTTILYGSNGWTFPEQDVNLTLSYPTLNQDVERELELEYFRITGYKIIMFTDGSDGAGIIASGGLMETHITLNLNMSRTTMLSYEFWLYGAPASQVGPSLLVNHNQMC